jgi:hypothetical protein
MVSDVERYESESELEARRARTEELKALGFDPRNPAHRVAVKIADELGLNLLLKELVVIPGKGAYVTRDGLLSLAHKSGVLDGIVLEDQGATEDHWYAVVSVYRKDMSHPFRYPGRYPMNGSNKLYGPEMAIKAAESMALRRAFRITGVVSQDEAYEVSEPPFEALDDETADSGMADGLASVYEESEEE